MWRPVGGRAFGSFVGGFESRGRFLWRAFRGWGLRGLVRWCQRGDGLGVVGGLGSVGLGLTYQLIHRVAHRILRLCYSVVLQLKTGDWWRGRLVASEALHEA
jgi:hypothetical protein